MVGDREGEQGRLWTLQMDGGHQAATRERERVQEEVELQMVKHCCRLGSSQSTRLGAKNCWRQLPKESGEKGGSGDHNLTWGGGDHELVMHER